MQGTAGEDQPMNRRWIEDELRRHFGPARAGLKWSEIAQELGGTADARRVQLQRAAGRVGRELGLEDDDE
jgi:hypothetical protein